MTAFLWDGLVSFLFVSTLQSSRFPSWHFFVCEMAAQPAKSIHHLMPCQCSVPVWQSSHSISGFLQYHTQNTYDQAHGRHFKSNRGMPAWLQLQVSCDAVTQPAIHKAAEAPDHVVSQKSGERFAGLCGPTSPWLGDRGPEWRSADALRAWLLIAGGRPGGLNSKPQTLNL